MKLKKSLSVLASVCLFAMTSLSSGMTLSANADYARVSVHDPSVVKLADGSYYIIGSHLGAARSDDLMNWYSAANSNLGSTRTTFFNNIYTDLQGRRLQARPARKGIYIRNGKKVLVK